MLENSVAQAAFVGKQVETFSLGSRWIIVSVGLRLDASFYNPRVAEAISALQRSGMTLKRLDQVTERIFMPTRFKRIYVDRDNGIPFLQGSHLVHFQPAGLKYLSRAAQKTLDTCIIRAGWVLVTRSGTIGRLAITSDNWDGWAASEHIIRIVPEPSGACPAGYLYAYLSSPTGQAQLTANIYGAVVDELTEDQTRSVLVPVPETPHQHAIVDTINRLATGVFRKKDEAVCLADQSTHAIDNLLLP